MESETGGDSYAHKVLMEDRESSGNHGDMNVMKVWDRYTFKLLIDAVYVCHFILAV